MGYTHPIKSVRGPLYDTTVASGRATPYCHIIKLLEHPKASDYQVSCESETWPRALLGYGKKVSDYPT
jgi:hypothetical protein